MEKWLKRSVDLLTSLSLGTDGDPSVVPYYPQKTEISSVENKYFKRSSPERHGISSRRIYNMLAELEWERRANVHSLMILSDGEVISECSREGYSVNTFHLSHSMSKTVTGLAVGILCDEGELTVNDKLADLFPEISYKDPRFSSITVEHLLSMQSGIPFSEAGSVTETAWTDAIFSSTLRFTPGTEFAYNSMNSYMLGRIVERVAGMSLLSFVSEKIFSPLGITNYFWEKGPEGTEKGGWGLYLSAESWAKLGYTILMGGVFEGKRILSEEWVRSATRPHALSPMSNGDFNYAYQMWVGRDSDEILFNGMLGQNVWICPKNRIVAVITSGNNELFQMSPALDIIRKYLGCDISDRRSDGDLRVLREREERFFDSRRFAVPLEPRRGLLYFLRLRPDTPFDHRWDDILDEMILPKNNISMLPLIVSGMQNNLSAGIESITLERSGESLIMSFTEGDAEYSLEIGLYGYKHTVLDFRGEKYAVSTIGEAHYGRQGMEYRIELLFPELPNTRTLCIVKNGDDVYEISFSEMPNHEILNALIARIPAKSSVVSFALDLLKRRYGENFIENKLEGIFSPTVTAFSAEAEDLYELIEEEERRMGEQSGIERVIRALVSRFFRESDTAISPTETDEDSSQPLTRTITGFFSKITGK